MSTSEMPDSVESPSIAPPIQVDQDGWSAFSASTGTDMTTDEAGLRSTLTEDAPAGETAPAEAPETAAEPTKDAVEAKAEPVKGAEAPKRAKTAAERTAELRAEINALTRAKHAERAEIERLRQEREALTRHASAQTAAPSPAPTAVAPEVGEKPTWQKWEAEGKSWDDFNDARDAWIEKRAQAEAARVVAEQLRAKEVEDRTHREQEQQAQAKREAELAQELADAAYRERVEEVIAERPDFPERAAKLDAPRTKFMDRVVMRHPAGAKVLDSLADEPEVCKTLAALTKDGQPSNAMMAALEQMDDPRPLLWHWAAHPTEFHELAGKPAHVALVALGRLLARFDGAKTGSPLTPKPITTAAPPIRPVGGTRSGAAGRSLDEMDFGPDYVREANQREFARRRHL